MVERESLKKSKGGGNYFSSPKTNMENWRPAPGFSNYEVSDYGRVRYIGNSRCNTFKGKILIPQLIRRGYHKFCLRRDGTTVQVLLHVLVLLAFVGPRPSPNHFGLHKDDNSANNTVSNLYWGTKKENMADSTNNGTFRRGLTSTEAALNKETLQFVRSSKLTSTAIAKKLGTSIATISRARNFRTYAND